ncbi:MAG: dihydrolipoyl dehydrogenase [Candidatus Thermoplasmatota archaeon]
MKKYDTIVLGDGSAGTIVQQSLMQGMKTALVDKGPLGGTCLNFGCIPSKMIIYPADRIMDLKEAEKLGIKAEIKDIDFKNIMERMKNNIRESHEHMKGIDQIENLDYYNGEGKFIDEYILEINGEEIKGEKIFIGTGARPLIPSIKGIENVDYLTNENVFDLKEKPESIIIVGGGYIAVEFAHFFDAVGTKVTILQRSNRLVKNEEPEISDLLNKKLSERMKIHLNTEVIEIKNKDGKKTVVGKNINTKERKEYTAEKILIAAGRKSNADLLNLEKTDVETDGRGYIKVDNYLKTSKENIWALGDATGRAMFKHVANEEAYIAWNNAINEEKMTLDYDIIPEAIFTRPQIASVGMTEKEAEKEHEILVGKAKYNDVAKGEAMVEKDGFAKAIFDKDSHKILGFHIIGPYAPILIQEVINAMALGGKIQFLYSGLHIHPALSELILSTFGNPEEK